jgi:hypothetical protein
VKVLHCKTMTPSTYCCLLIQYMFSLCTLQGLHSGSDNGKAISGWDATLLRALEESPAKVPVSNSS